MLVYMRSDPIFWIVPASIALAVGTTATLLAILQHNLNLQIVDTNTILLSSIGGIAIGIIGLVMGYYYFQMKPSKIMERILTEVKIRDTTEVKQREGRKKNYYLHRISSNTLRITKNLVRIENLIGKYSDDPPPKDWQIVRYSADRSRKQTEELRKKIVLDFAQIIDLVQNPRLADKFGVNNLFYTLYLFDEILRIDPEHDKELLRGLWSRLENWMGHSLYLKKKKTPDVEYIDDDIPGFVRRLIQQPVGDKDIWLLRGGEMVSIFLNADLVDEIILSDHSIILGKGIPLFNNIKKRVNLRLLESIPFESGLVQLCYRILEY
jgi:hypothetical protein